MNKEQYDIMWAEFYAGLYDVNGKLKPKVIELATLLKYNNINFSKLTEDELDQIYAAFTIASRDESPHQCESPESEVAANA